MLSRVLLALVAFAGGALVGVITTFTHRQLPPWGLLAGLLIIAALLVGTRLAFAGRLVAVAAGLGIAAVVVVLSMPSATGGVLVVNDPLGIAWAILPMVVAVVAVAWPGRRARPEAASDSE